jgi:rhodanese-related sulfurtransferase
MHALERNKLRHIINDEAPLYVINVLGPREFARARIPGSHNIPLDEADFVRRVERLVGARDARIVVYCANFQCTASSRAARQLEDAGYNRVFEYPGGMQDWQEAGYPVEGGE